MTSPRTLARPHLSQFHPPAPTIYHTDGIFRRELRDDVLVTEGFWVLMEVDEMIVLEWEEGAWTRAGKPPDDLASGLAMEDDQDHLQNNGTENQAHDIIYALSSRTNLFRYPLYPSPTSRLTVAYTKGHIGAFVSPLQKRKRGEVEWMPIAKTGRHQLAASSREQDDSPSPPSSPSPIRVQGGFKSTVVSIAGDIGPDVHANELEQDPGLTPTGTRENKTLPACHSITAPPIISSPKCSESLEQSVPQAPVLDPSSPLESLEPSSSPTGSVSPYFAKGKQNERGDDEGAKLDTPPPSGFFKPGLDFETDKLTVVERKAANEAEKEGGRQLRSRKKVREAESKKEHSKRQGTEEQEEINNDDARVTRARSQALGIELVKGRRDPGWKM